MKAIVFDLDGTLIDSVPDLHAAARAVLEEEGVAPLDLPTIRSFVGNGMPVLLTRIMAARDIDAAEHTRLLERFRDIYSAHPAEFTTLYPNVTATLGALKGQGFGLGICTNKPGAPTRAILNAFGIAGAFSTVIGGDTAHGLKPDPAPLRAAFAELGAEETLFVGDSETDAETATATATPFALFTEGYRNTPVAGIRHDHVFGDHADLTRIVAELFRP